MVLRSTESQSHRSLAAVLRVYCNANRLLCFPHLFTVVALLNEIRDVNVEEETVRYFGKGYLVVLRFVTGFSHPLTQSAVLGCRRCSVDFLN